MLLLPRSLLVAHTCLVQPWLDSGRLRAAIRRLEALQPLATAP